MIQLIGEGLYKLIETRNLTKILTLGQKDSYAWVSAGGIGEILVNTEKIFMPFHVLSSGKYRIYQVKDEPKLTDLVHLELFVGEGNWQGYLLPTGLPNADDKRNRIISTKEIITKSTH